MEKRGVALLACLFITTNAYAEGPEAPGDEAKPEAEAPAPPEAPQDPKWEEARHRFLQGVALARAGNCDAALGELEASLELVRRPSTLFNIAQCNERLYRYDRAVNAYEEFLKIAEQEDPDRRIAEATMRTLRGLLGTVVIKCNVEDAEVWLDSRRVGTAPGQILLPGGQPAIEIRKDGYLPARRTVKLAGRQTVTVDVELRQLEQSVHITQKSSGLPPLVFWTGTVATGVAAATGAAFGVHALVKHNGVRNTEPLLRTQDEIDTVRRSRTLADIFYVSAGVLAVGTTVVYFLTDWNEEQVIAPMVGGDSVGVSWGGTL